MNHDRRPAGVTDGVLEDVDERALELGAVGVDERQAGFERQLELAPADLLGRGPGDLLHRRPLTARSGGPRLEPGQVEELIDEARQPRGLGADDLGELVALLRV